MFARYVRSDCLGCLRLALLIVAACGVLPLPFGSGAAAAQVINVPAGNVPSLIAAIQAANASAAVPATINVTGTYSLMGGVAGVPFLHDGKTGLPSITSDITVVGPGAVIERTPATCAINGDANDTEFRIFHVASTGVLTLSGLTVRNGCADGTIFDERSGGGVYNEGVVTLLGTTLTANFATSGGGIANFNGTVNVVQSSTLSSNRAEDDGGAIANFGVPATVNVTNSTLSGNQAKFFGGGIENFNGRVYITGSTVHMNSSNVEGGGVFNTFSMLNQPVLTVTGSTFSENESGLGGGIFTSEKVDIIASTFVDNRATQGAGVWKEGLELNVTNSTFSGNIAVEEGGGIYNDDFDVTIVSSTFSGNSAGGGGALFNFGTVNVTSSILANSVAGGDCGGPESAELFAMGVNFDTDGTCKAAAADSATGDAFTTVTAGELNLDVLALNAPGRTMTHALLENSVAIDVLSPSQCAVSQDQRGVSRPQNGRCDSGAYEVLVPGSQFTAPVLSPWLLLLLTILLGLVPSALQRDRRKRLP